MTLATRAVVFGGTGFLGRRVVDRLARRGAHVVVAARHPQAPQDLPDRVTVAPADVNDLSAVARAVEGAEAVVNCVAHYVETAEASFHDVHVAGARNVAAAARESGAVTLVHISGIGTRASSPSPYVRARAEGEAGVRDAFGTCTILRPSVMFGIGDAFLSGIARVARLTPVMPLFGRGRTRLQPVWVDDVAAAVEQVVEPPTQSTRTFELGGPEILSYRAVVRRVLDWSGIRRPLLPTPWPVWRAVAALARVVPAIPVTESQVALMRDDNVVARDARGFADLNIQPTPMIDVVPTYLGEPEPDRG